MHVKNHIAFCEKSHFLFESVILGLCRISGVGLWKALLLTYTGDFVVTRKPCSNARFLFTGINFGIYLICNSNTRWFSRKPASSSPTTQSPTPDGVPVKITSPIFKEKYWEIFEIIFSKENIILLVSPF